MEMKERLYYTIIIDYYRGKIRFNFKKIEY